MRFRTFIISRIIIIDRIISMENKQHHKRKFLRDFKSNLKFSLLFSQPQANLPPFFNQNLLDEARTIKVFTADPFAYIKIFYFQFLKLCFQAEDIDYTTKINKFIEALQGYPNLLRLDGKYAHSGLSTEDVKDILFQFLEILSECKQPVETTLSKYPIISEVLTVFLSNFLKQHLNMPIENFNQKIAIEKLADYFLVQIVDYDQCIQYTDSQVYSYKQSDEKIYMIYIDDSKVTKIKNLQRDEAIKNSMHKTDFFEEMKEIPVSSSSSMKTEEQDKYYPQVIRFDLPDIVFHDQSKIEVKVENPNDHKSSFRGSMTDQSNYSGKKNTISTNSTITRGTNTNTLKTMFQTEERDKQNQSSVNISKEFTQTFILENVVAEPYRSRIKQIKRKAREQRKSKKPFFT